MKHTARYIEAFLFAMLLVLVSSNSQGASLLYSPASVDMSLTAGSQGTASLTITVQDPGRGASFSLWFVDSFLDGNLPLGWLSPTPATTFLDSVNVTASTTLAVNVPAGTAPGVYSGRLLSKAMAAHGFADAGSGSLIQITVLSRCVQPPRFEISSFGPASLWPPNHKMTEVAASGRVILDEGCTLLESGYDIVDEYGLYTSAGQLTVSSDGTFSISLSLEAWRNSNDLDGRHYTIMLSARDEAGSGSGQRLDVLVPHDDGSLESASKERGSHDGNSHGKGSHDKDAHDKDSHNEDSHGKDAHDGDSHDKDAHDEGRK